MLGDLYVKVLGAGVFSRFTIAVQRVIYHINDLDSVKSIYIDNWWEKSDPTRNVPMDGNPFDFVLHQNRPEEVYQMVEASPIGAYHDIINHADLPRLREVCRKIVIKDEVLNRINPDINSNTLGIHFRLTDMNALHAGDYGYVRYKDYKARLDWVLDNSPIKSLFVASDNVASVRKLRKHYGSRCNIISNDNLCNQAASETDSQYNQRLRANSSNLQLWQDSFLEALSLSRCGALMYRTSNLSNAAVMLSDNIKQTYVITGKRK